MIAYLIYTHNMSYDAALDLVKRKRACVKPNSGFVRYVTRRAILGPPLC